MLVSPKISVETPKKDLETLAQTNSPTALESPKRPYLDVAEYAIETARKNDLNPQYFLRLIQCESAWQEDALGDSKTSFGLLQFKKDTFSLFSNKFDFHDYNISNSYHQVDLAAKMIKEGYIFHWKNCARKIGWTK